jgi:SM-20-related protein
MQPNLDRELGEPLVEVMEDLAPRHLHAAAWATCSGKNWYFGHSSNESGAARFWKMDLDGDAAFDAIWQSARVRCEALAGTPLRVIRQYANGHTYGLGGDAHVDDTRPGAFTLLYYPNPEWHAEWQGETVFFDGAGEIALAVRPQPNRAIFFDSRISHAGRAPGRSCPALRVTVAFKLEAVSARRGPRLVDSVAGGGAATVAENGEAAVSIEGDASGAPDEVRRVYRARVAGSEIERAVERRLRELGESVRLPGFRPGKVPYAALVERYGAEARATVLRKLASRIMERDLPEGSVPSACELAAGAEAGDMEIAIAATHMPALPEIDLSEGVLEKLESDGPASAEALRFLRERLKQQALDRLDAAYAFPLLPALVEREFAGLWKLAESQAAIPGEAVQRRNLEIQFRGIAERRVRLAFVVAELARRWGIGVAGAAAMEDQVIDGLIARARVVTRVVSERELDAMMAGSI